VITVKCVPNSTKWLDTPPIPWEMGFEEAHLNVDDFAKMLSNIMMMAGYLPSQVWDVFKDAEEWGYSDGYKQVQGEKVPDEDEVS
jgi:hypothetical protein